jgi:Zn finger protein HypA/HybF involved in hydrogenase expression
MHELSTASALVDIAVRRGRPVATVEVPVGRLRQVVPRALELVFARVQQIDLLPPP